MAPLPAPETISTELYRQTEQDDLGTGLPPGSYVRITTRDTGTGISENLPSTKIPLLSGYTRRPGAEEPPERYPLIQKPYAYEVLAAALESAFESGRSARPA